MYFTGVIHLGISFFLITNGPQPPSTLTPTDDSSFPKEESRYFYMYLFNNRI